MTAREPKLGLSAFMAALPSAKRDTDTMWAKIILRPLSQPTAWALYRLGVTGNMVSIACVLLAIAGTLMLGLGDWSVAIGAAVIFNVVGLGDCIDGNIARASGEAGPGGEWVDALAGYTVYALLPLGLGFRVESAADPLGLADGVWMLLGALASSANLFMRVLHQKYANAFPSPKSEGRSSLAARISGEAGLAGWMMPLLLVSVIVSYEAWYLVLFSSFYCLSAAVVTAGMLYKVVQRAKAA